MNKRIFSGIQPTGNIHIGNYLGAIRNWVLSQHEFENIFSIVDLHAITTPQNPAILKNKTREVAGLMLAAGIDLKFSNIFIQSHVKEHAELTWILNCLTPISWVQKMTQFKDKSNKEEGNVSVGLFDYPALMAADILLYDTDLVPVGEDQKQHIELTRKIAENFNSHYGETFKIPKPIIPKSGARIMGLDDPSKKMSKSTANEYHSIGLLDSPEQIMKKIGRAATDSIESIVYDENRLGIYNLLIIY